MRLPLLSFFIIATILSGCAYYSTTSEYLPVHLQTIAIPAIQNRAYEAGLAEDLTRAVTDRFDATGRLSVVARKSAHSVLNVVITHIKDEPFTIGTGEIAKQYKLTLTVSASYQDLTTGDIMWQDAGLQVWETYELAGGIDRDTALQNAIEQLAADLFNRTLSGW